MNVLFDTNIILSIVRAVDYAGLINFLNPKDYPIYSSVVCEGEIKSLALQNKCGTGRMNLLENILDQINIIDISRLCINIYTEIDAFSQLRNPDFKDYGFLTPRNMGKNDLWIASLSALLGLQLVTTDSDFDHLHSVFFEVRKIDQGLLLPFFQPST
ncbi:type II toxin-antitoxin system VapC family toxin [Dyadobacter sandarakinus]|uniref:PIN domain-containing protein n=1 Tax=Dyadobacter sandarakinus TaxID=2747268 RepID=A0ABX7IDN6_9BACT|nr:PIN domain-containing protein [Dyadobacter sandarakinus]QRR03228.1 PIN domain-containing protein [Dyadobacter sandarakinus]